MLGTACLVSADLFWHVWCICLLQLLPHQPCFQKHCNQIMKLTLIAFQGCTAFCTLHCHDLFSCVAQHILPGASYRYRSTYTMCFTTPLPSCTQSGIVMSCAASIHVSAWTHHCPTPCADIGDAAGITTTFANNPLQRFGSNIGKFGTFGLMYIVGPSEVQVYKHLVSASL